MLLFLGKGWAQMKITEIMYNPSSSEDDWEYVELFNASSSPVTISGWVIDDGNGSYQTQSNIPAQKLGGYETIVLYNGDDISAADFRAAWGIGTSVRLVPVSNWGAMALNNGGDDVAIWSSMSSYGQDTTDPSGTTFNNATSHVSYDDDGVVWPQDDGSGSIQLKDSSADESMASGWALSVSTDGFSWTSNAAGGNSGNDVGSPGKQVPPVQNFTLQLLHYADVDGNEEVALDAVDEFSGLVDGLKKDPNYGSNTLLVSSGDMIIPGPRFYAAENNTVRGLTGSNEPGHLDVFFANKMGVQASAIGNHELDAGPGELFDAAFSSESRNGVTFPGSEFPWLATNIDFSQDGDFSGAIGTDGSNTTALNSKVAKYAITVVNGDTIGLIGASAPSLPTITSTGALTLTPSGDWSNQDLADVIQTSVDALKSMGVNKIVLLSHMQQISVEKDLAGLLDGVDIIVAGGSNTRMGDANDDLYSSSKITDASFDETYPYLTTDASGDPVAVVNVDGDYKYLGRLVVEFDDEGKMVTSTIDQNTSGVYASTASKVAALGGTPNADVVEVRDSVLSVINAQYQNIVGYSSVYLDGRRSQVRTQETNLGNLTADANLWYANELNPSGDAPVLVSIKNGGGIRTEIGTSKLPPGTNDPKDLEFFPPENNAVTEGHLRATLRFNNGLVRLTLTARELKDVLEHTLSEVAPGVTDGGFPQISGMSIVYNPTGKPSKVSSLKGSNGDDSLVVAEQGERVVSMVINQPDGSQMTIVRDGKLVVADTMKINVVTLNFLANGGDGYPFTIANFTNRRMNYYSGTGFGESTDFPDGELTNDPGNSSDISNTGGEQDALAEYMFTNFPQSAPFDVEEEDIEDDGRIMRTLRVLDEDPAPFTNVLKVQAIGNFQVPGNVFDESAAEIPAFDAERNQLFFTDANSDAVHVLDLSDPTNPTLKTTIALGGGPNSVAVFGDIVAVAVEADPKQNPGKVEFYSAVDFSKTGEVTVGALPDMVTFNEDGTKVLTANEGEPSGDYLTDPEGSVSIVTLNTSNLSNSTVATADFTSFNSNIPAGVRVFGRSASGEGDAADGFATTLAQDIEPEYITVKGNKAYVTCQENNALAIVNIDNSTVESLLPLGTVDHSVAGNGLDASNRDDSIYISQWPIKGMYLPDAIASFEAGGMTYLITANEGDAREYEYEDMNGDDVLSFIDETRVKDLKLDPTAFPYADLLQQDDQLGRIKTSLVDGDTDGDGDHDEIYTYGTRSFTIWDASTGAVVWDSKNALEQITKQSNPAYFNATNDENNFDNRSDDKGPEPEGVTVGMVDGKMYSFVGLERVGGIVIYDISNPAAPTFAHYISTRDFSGDPEVGTAGNLAPEGLVFIPAEESPNRTALLVVTYEVSGSVEVFEIGDQLASVTNKVDAKSNLSVYPNPSSETVSFRLKNDDNAQVVIYNSVGVEVFKQEFSSSLTVSKDELNQAGVYYYEVLNQGVTTTGKIVFVN
jgi:2',3'-cyclic-nucleotide 2'-phosphodiesterase/3'-nucleotidase/5'-nucleotidase